MKSERSIGAVRIAGMMVATSLCLFFVSCREKTGDAKPATPEKKPVSNQVANAAQSVVAPAKASATKPLDATKARFNEVQRERMTLQRHITDAKQKAMASDPAIAALVEAVRAASAARQDKINSLPAMVEKLKERDALVKQIGDIQARRKALGEKVAGQAGNPTNSVAELGNIDRQFAETRQKLSTLSREISGVSMDAQQKDPGVKAASEELRARNAVLDAALAKLPGIAALIKRDDELKKEEMGFAGELDKTAGNTGAQWNNQQPRGLVDGETGKLAVLRRIEEVKKDAVRTNPEIASLQKELADLKAERMNKIQSMPDIVKKRDARDALMKERKELLEKRRAAAMQVQSTNAPAADAAQIEARLKVVSEQAGEVGREFSKAFMEARKSPEFMALDAQIQEKQRMLNEKFSKLPAVEELRKKLVEFEGKDAAGDQQPKAAVSK
ncbi:MAG: hypothetical protein WCL44_02385 [bacterium]